jgi:hypothetical protein
MNRPGPLGNQNLDASTYQLGAGVSEKRFHLRIRFQDAPLAIDYDDCVG